MSYFGSVGAIIGMIPVGWAFYRLYFGWVGVIIGLIPIAWPPLLVNSGEMGIIIQTVLFGLSVCPLSLIQVRRAPF